MADRAPDSYSSENLRAWKALRSRLTPFEMALIHQDSGQSVAARESFSDNPRFENANKHNRALLAILDANGRFLSAEGRRLTTVREYRAYKKPGDPSPATIIELFGSWPAAKAAAGIANGRRTGPALLRTKGERNTHGSGVHWTFDLRVRAVATFREYGCPGAYRLGTDQYLDWREEWPETLPHYIVVIGQIDVIGPDGKKVLRKDGKPQKEREFSWAQMNDFADELALREPHNFPLLAERVRMERGLA
jgi:hypothetical protein